MKLGFSNKGDRRGRHLVLVMDRFEHWDARPLILSEILKDRSPEEEWDDERFVFRCRFHLSFLNKILLTFPQAELSPGLDRHVVRMQKRRMDLLDVPDIAVPGLYDFLLMKDASLYDFQKIGVAKIEKAMSKEFALGPGEVPGFFENDAMGLGKTIQAMSVLVRAAQGASFPALVTAPNSGKWAWKKIIDRFFDDDFSYVVVDGTPADRRAQILAGADLTIAGWEQIRVERRINRTEGGEPRFSLKIRNPWFFYEDPMAELVPNQFFEDERDAPPRRIWRTYVPDEHHRAKNPDNQVTQGFLMIEQDLYLPMSGTPFLNCVEEIWPALHKKDPERFPTLYQFSSELCITSDAGGRVVGYRPEKMAELKRYLRTRSIRRRPEHVGEQMPDVVYTTRLVELTPEQRRLYNKIRDEALLLLEDGSEKRIVNVLAQITRLKQACFSPELYGGSSNSAKIAEMAADIEELVASGEKAIVFSQWSKATRILQREFEKYDPAYVDGSVKGSKRSVQEDKFNSDDGCKLYIGTIGANREAITLGAATYVLFADKDWSPLANQQAAARSAAGGLRGAGLAPGTKVNIVEYLALDTVEEHIEDLLARKQQIFNSLIERDGGRRYPKLTVKDIRAILAA